MDNAQAHSLNRMPFFPFFLFLLALFLGPARLFDFFTFLPGGNDSLLNNYFLENIYKFLNGDSPSLIHFSFFYPYKYVLGFSDNLFGCSAPYLFCRFFGFDEFTSFQIWYYLSYFFNFLAAYYALRKCKISEIASSFGALFFTFAMPIIHQCGHVQLAYRFGVPLAITYFLLFLKNKNWFDFLKSFFWTTLQIYSTIYIGVFLLFFLLCTFFVEIIFISFFIKISISQYIKSFYLQWRESSKNDRILFITILFALLLSLIILFYPYFMVTKIYGFKRDWLEIQSMIPRVGSYFLADWYTLEHSFLPIDNIPMRHEHQLFIGLVPFLLFIGSCIFYQKLSHNNIFFATIFFSLILVVISSIYVDGYSLWKYICKLPLFSAIRAVSRIILVLLFPIAFLLSHFLDFAFLSRKKYRIVPLVLIGLFLLETCFITCDPLSRMLKTEVRESFITFENSVKEKINSDSILFCKAGLGHERREIEAMWAALNLGIKTLNGYSGCCIDGYDIFDFEYPEARRRLLLYMKDNDLLEAEAYYQKKMQKIVPWGFSGPQGKLPMTAPNYTIAYQPYPRELLSQLSFSDCTLTKKPQNYSLDIQIKNNSSINFSAFSASGHHLRVCCRFLDKDHNVLSDWFMRKSFSTDIPAHGTASVVFNFTINNPASAFIEIGIVQEHQFWLHDLGVSTKIVPL